MHRAARRRVKTTVGILLCLAGCGGDDSPAVRHTTKTPAGQPARTQINIAGRRDTGGDLLAFSQGILAGEERRRRDAAESDAAPITRREGPMPASARGDSIDARRERLIGLIRAPDAAGLSFAAETLAAPLDPLSPLAAVAVGRIGGPRAEDALRRALRDARPEVRACAVAGLLEAHAGDASAVCRAALQDPHAGVRSAAAEMLGDRRDHAAADALRETLAKDAPQVRFAAAWALARLGDDAGLNFLEAMALAEDPQMSPAAIRTLGNVGDVAATRVLYRALFSRKEFIRRAAVAALAATPEDLRAETVAKTPPNLRSSWARRFDLLRCAAGGGAMPAECLLLARNGNREERILALQCFVAAGGIAAIPGAIAGLDDESEDVRTAAEDALRILLKRNPFDGTPSPGSAAAEWRRWWIRQYRAGSVRADQATVVAPDGRGVRVRVGSRLDDFALVTRLVPETRAVETVCDGAPLRIVP